MEKTIKWKIEIDDSQAGAAAQRVENGLSSMTRASKRLMEAEERRVAAQRKRGSESIAKNLPLAAAPIFQPTSFWANAIAVNRIQAMLQTPQGKAMLGNLGVSGGVFTGAAVAAMVALGLAIKGLKLALEKAKEAIEFSGKTYIKSVQSGMGVGGATSRSLIAQALGVDEKDIFQFGAAMQYIQPRIKASAAAISSAVVPLTKLRVDIEILKIKFLAFGSVLAVNLMPIIESFLNALGSFSDFLTQSNVVQGAMTVLIKVLQVIQFNIQSVAIGFQLAADGILVLMAAINDLIHFLAKINPVIKLISKMSGVGTTIMSPDALKKFATDAKAGEKAQFDLAKSILGLDDSGKPKGAAFASPAAFAKQMPASAWEKMGLVIGGGGVNHAAETAKNTKKTAQTLDKILQAVVSGAATGAPIFSPAYNNP